MHRDAFHCALCGRNGRRSTGPHRICSARPVRSSQDSPLLASHPLYSTSSRRLLEHPSDFHFQSDLSARHFLRGEALSHPVSLTRARERCSHSQWILPCFARGQLPVISHQMEAMMSRVINFDKGSKRRIQQIRWSRFEIFTAVLLCVIVLSLGLLFVLWEASHDSVQSWVHQVEERH